MSDILLTGKSLIPGDRIISPKGGFEFRYQDDGNLVLYRGTEPIWSTKKFSKDPGQCIMQLDGNLVCEDKHQNPYWASGSYERFIKTDAHLVAQDDGNVVIYKTVPIWAVWNEGVPDFIRPCLPNWMKSFGHNFSQIPLNELKLICSHDSGTYRLRHISNYGPHLDALIEYLDDFLEIFFKKYPDISKVANKGIKQLIKTNTTIQQWIMEFFKDVAQCQRLTIKDQLDLGIRVLDLRIAFDDCISLSSQHQGEEFFLAHGIILTDVTVKDVLDQVKEFIKSNPFEVVILDFHRVELYNNDPNYEKFKPEELNVHDQLRDDIIKSLDALLIRYNDKIPTLSEVWEKPGRVIVAWNLNCDKIRRPEEFFPPINGEWKDDLYTENELYSFIAQNIRNHHKETEFWSMCGVLKQIGSIEAKNHIVSLSNELSQWFDLRSEWIDELKILTVNFVEDNSSVIYNTIIKNSSLGSGRVICDRLLTNQSLVPGAKIVSPNGSFEFRYQDDGSLALYKESKLVWSTKKFSKNPGQCIMQDDGNLVCEDKDHNPYWASGTYERFSKTDAHLVVQDDGNVVIYKTMPIWDTYNHPQR